MVAVIGRPNVGKSTLFNRLVGRRVAIVDSMPGVTRDRLYATIEWDRCAFQLVDTAGILTEVLEDFEMEIQQQVEAAMQQADVLLFVVDGKTGPTAEEDDLAQMLRSTGKPLVLVVNKVDGGGQAVPAEFHRWGFERAIAVSALYGTRTGDLLDLVLECMPVLSGVEAGVPEDAIQVAVIGQQNVGKSSLVNRLVGEQRMVVSDVPGTTRDPVDTLIRFHTRPIVLIDTAGLRKKMKTSSGVDYYTLLRTVYSIQRCDVAVLMLDSRVIPSRQDIRIADMAIERGKGLILALNKWDLVENKETNTPVEMEKRLKQENPQLQFAPVIFISAKTSQRVSKLLDLVVGVSDERSLLVPTPRLNEALQDIVSQNHPPSVRGRTIRLMYCTQVQIEPPTFVIYSNDPDNLPEHYRRYVLRRFREYFPFTGTPVRLFFRKSEKKRENDRGTGRED
jgi:GTPase